MMQFTDHHTIWSADASFSKAPIEDSRAAGCAAFVEIGCSDSI
jgi:hypothetical protein